MKLRIFGPLPTDYTDHKIVNEREVGRSRVFELEDGDEIVFTPEPNSNNLGMTLIN